MGDVSSECSIMLPHCYGINCVKINLFCVLRVGGQGGFKEIQPGHWTEKKDGRRDRLINRF